MSNRRKPRRKGDNAGTDEENQRDEDTGPEDESSKEEEKIKKTLAEAGIEPEGMSCEEVLQIYKMLQDSKTQFAHEEEMRKMVDDSGNEEGGAGPSDASSSARKTARDRERNRERNRDKRQTLSRSDSPEFEDLNESGDRAHKSACEGFTSVLQLSIDNEENGDATRYDEKLMDETDVHPNGGDSTKGQSSKDVPRPGSVTIIDDESMDETIFDKSKKSTLSQHTQDGKTTSTQEAMELTCLTGNNSNIGDTRDSKRTQSQNKTKTTNESMDLTCLTGESSGDTKRTRRQHNITDFENKSMNETNINTTRTATPKYWDLTSTEDVAMDETAIGSKDDKNEEIDVVSTEEEPDIKPRKKKRKCMLLISESDTENEAPNKSKEEKPVEEEKVNVSLQCSLPLDALDQEDAANLIEDAKKQDEDPGGASDSDESVIFSGHSKTDVVEESMLQTPEHQEKKGRMALGSNDADVIPETQEQDRSSSPVTPGSAISAGDTQRPYEGETLDPTGVDDYEDMETQDMNGAGSPSSPNVFSPVKQPGRRSTESVEILMTEPTRDDEDELAAAEAVLTSEEKDEDDIDDNIPLLRADNNDDVVGPINFGCDYKVKTLSSDEIASIIEKLSAPKPKKFDMYDPPEAIDKKGDEESTDQGPSSPPVPSLINKRRLKRCLYDPCPMYAPSDENITNYTFRISKYWDDYAKCLRAAQEKCHACIPWGNPVEAGDHAKDSIGLPSVDLRDLEEDNENTASSREKRYAERKRNQAAFLAQFNMPGSKDKKEDLQGSHSPEQMLPDLTNSPPNTTSSPKAFIQTQSDSDSEFEVTAPKKKRGRPAGTGTGRGRGRGKKATSAKKKEKKPMNNIMEYLQSHDTEDDDSLDGDALRAAKEEIFGESSMKSSSKRRKFGPNKFSWSPPPSKSNQEDVGLGENKENEDDEVNLLANLSGQATFADDQISISSSNRTTPAEEMLKNVGARHSELIKNQKDVIDDGAADRNSLDDLELEVPDDPAIPNDPLENDGATNEGAGKRGRQRETTLSSDEETQDLTSTIVSKKNSSSQEDIQLFQDIPERPETVKRNRGSAQKRRLTRAKKNVVPPFDKDGHVTRAVKVGNQVLPLPSPRPKRVAKNSESDVKPSDSKVFDFDSDNDDPMPLHLQWNKTKNIQTYSRRGRGQKTPKIDQKRNEEREDSPEPPQEPVTMVACPLCQKEFPQTEVERHAATCLGGDIEPEPVLPPVPGPSRSPKPTPQKRKRQQAESDDDDLEFLEEDPMLSLKRAPLRKRGRGEPKDEERPKRGRAKNKTHAKGRKEPVVEVIQEQPELNDVDEEARSPTPPLPRDQEATSEKEKECIICFKKVPESEFEAHVIQCCNQAEVAAEEKRTTRAKRK